MSLWTLLGLDRVLYGVAYLLGHIYDLRPFTLALSWLVYYFEISISTLIELNVGYNSRIDVLCPTHTHTQAMATLSSLCYIFVFLMWFPRVVYWSRRIGQVDVDTKSFVICCSDGFFPFARLVWHNLRKIANFNWSYGKPFYGAICVPYTQTHSRTVAVLANT